MHDHLRSLTTSEQRILMDVLNSMSRASRRDYQSYLTTGGHKFTDVEDIMEAHRLYDKGWLVKPVDMLDMNPVYLTPQAWRRYALDEWEEVEETILEKERGNESGSW